MKLCLKLVHVLYSGVLMFYRILQLNVTMNHFCTSLQYSSNKARHTRWINLLLVLAIQDNHVIPNFTCSAGILQYMNTS